MAVGTLTVQLVAKTTQATRAITAFRKRINGISKATHVAQRSLAAFNRQLAGFGFVAGAVASFKSLVETQHQFQVEMAKSTAIMGELDDRMRSTLEMTARRVSRSTVFSAREAATAYFYLASAGLNAEQSVAALPQVAKFAQAGMFDLKVATDLATDAQAALGIKSQDAAENLKGLKRVTDVLVRANTLSNATVEQFSVALTTKAGAAIKFANKEIEEGVAILAAFADQGLKGADAGTALNIVFRDLQTKAIENAKAFRENNVAVFDSQGNMLNVADTLAMMEKEFGNLSVEAQKFRLMQLGMTDKTVVFMQTLLGTSEAIRLYQEELENAANFTDIVAEKNMTPFTRGLEMLKATWEDLAATIGPSVLSDLALVFETISSIAQESMAFRDAMGGTGENLGPVAKAIGFIGDTFNGISIAIKGFVLVVQGVATTITVVIEALLDKLFTVMSWLGEVDQGPRDALKAFRDSMIEQTNETYEGLVAQIEGLTFSERLQLGADAAQKRNQQRKEQLAADFAAAEERRKALAAKRDALGLDPNKFSSLTMQAEEEKERAERRKSFLSSFFSMARFGQALVNLPQVTSPPNRVNRVLEEGTAEAFKAARQNLKPDMDKQQLELQKKAVGFQDKISRGIDNLVNWTREAVREIPR